ncbi:MAG: FtsX-like permease family protein, partial [Candidatus Heimdallarchaeota archaeon]
ITIEQSSSLPYLLYSPMEELQNSYGRANTVIMVMIPVALFGVLQALFAINVIIEKRKNELAIMKERGAQTIQLLNSTFLEFSIVMITSTIIAGALSFLLASLIPALGLGRFSSENFVDFFRNIEIVIVPYLFTSIGILVVTLIFVGYKVNKVLPKTYSERDLAFRYKMEKWISLGLLIAGTLGVIIYFIIFGLEYSGSINNIFNFTQENTVDSSYAYLFISIIIILSGVLIGIGFIEILSRLRPFYVKIFKKSGFFIAHNFKRSKHSLNTILIVTVILSSTLIFSLSLRDSYKNVESNTNYYNNGADFRIETESTHHNLKLSLMLEDGIDDVMSVLRSGGTYASYSQVTLLGVDAAKYSSMGRWIDNSFIYDSAYVPPGYEIRNTTGWLMALNMVRDGIIISDGLARDAEKEVGDTIMFTQILIGGSTIIHQEFIITGVIHSAPGFGLATGENLELDQPNDHFALINFRKANEDFGVNNTNLFFASLEDGYQLEEVTNTILGFDEVLAVNPEFTSGGFSDRYINNYVPSLDSFIVTQIILISFLGMIILVTNISYIISTRRRTSVILSVLGNTRATLTNTILNEIILMDLTAIFTGLLVGLPLGVIGVRLMQPYFLNKVIYPVNFAINGLYLVLIIVGIFVVTILAAIPSLIKLFRSKAVDELHGLT